MNMQRENPFPSTEMVARATGIKPWARLSTNENEFGTAPEVTEAIIRAAAEAHRYPDCEHYDLRTVLAAEAGVDFDQVHVRTGIDGLLGDCCRVFAGNGCTVLTTEGTYATFAYFAAAVGARVETVPYCDFHVDSNALVRRALECSPEVVYVAEPDNPTGGSLGSSGLHHLRQCLPERTLLLVDGAYAEYQDPARRIVPADLLDQRMLWLRTFSKAYGLAGLRVGYVLGAAELLRKLRSVAEHYSVGRIAQQAAMAALTATGHRDWVIEETTQGRAHYAERLTGLGFTMLKSETNFVTVRCTEQVSAETLRAALAKAGVLTRVIPLGCPYGLLRLTIGPVEQRVAVLRLLAGLRSWGEAKHRQCDHVYIPEQASRTCRR